MNTQILDEAKRLSLSERVELVEAIWDTIAEGASVDQLPIPEWHREELDRRLLDLESNPGAGSPWDEVRKRLERRR